MTKRSNKAFLWSLFVSCGMTSALIFPVLLFLFSLAIPLSCIDEPSYRSLLALAKRPLAQLALFTVYSLSLFHRTHRFRFTLYNRLQIKHLNELITVFCY